MENDISGIYINEENGTMTIRWDTGSKTGALNSITMKIEVIDKTYNTYEAPHIPWDQNYNEAF